MKPIFVEYITPAGERRSRVFTSGDLLAAALWSPAVELVQAVSMSVTGDTYAARRSFAAAAIRQILSAGALPPREEGVILWAWIAKTARRYGLLRELRERWEVDLYA